MHLQAHGKLDRSDQSLLLQSYVKSELLNMFALHFGGALMLVHVVKTAIAVQVQRARRESFPVP
jgi:hypothetical protein